MGKMIKFTPSKKNTGNTGALSLADPAIGRADGTWLENLPPSINEQRVSGDLPPSSPDSSWFSETDKGRGVNTTGDWGNESQTVTQKKSGDWLNGLGRDVKLPKAETPELTPVEKAKVAETEAKAEKLKAETEQVKSRSIGDGNATPEEEALAAAKDKKLNTVAAIGGALSSMGDAVGDAGAQGAVTAANENVKNTAGINAYEQSRTSSLYGPNSKYPFLTMDMLSKVDQGVYTDGVAQSSQSDRSKVVVGGILKGVGAGVSTGAMIGGPWGAAIGAVTGLVTGLAGAFKAKKMREADERAMADALRRYEEAVRARNSARNVAAGQMKEVNKRDNRTAKEREKKLKRDDKLRVAGEKRGVSLGVIQSGAKKLKDIKDTARNYQSVGFNLGR